MPKTLARRPRRLHSLLNRSSTCPTSKIPSWKRILATDFQRRSSAYLQAIAADTTEFQDLLDAVFSSRESLLPPTEPNGFAPFALDVLRGLQIPAVSSAIFERQVFQRKARFERRDIERNIFLFMAPEARVFLLVVADIFVERLPSGEEYPPRGHHIASTRRMARKWETKFSSGKQADRRLPRRPIHILQSDRLALSIPEDLSCRLYDRETRELVLVVIRRFCNHSALLTWVSRVVQSALKSRRSVRMEDLGVLIQLGFSAGSRSNPSFGFVKNFLSKAAGAGDAELRSNRELASALIYFWLRSKALFPSEVVDDISAFYSENDIPRFDPDWPASREEIGVLELPFGATAFAFEDVERAPGCAVAVDGYARAVHMENAPHRWALGWNHVRRGSSLLGGHFYLAAYGVEMRASADTAWAWCPSMWHTTGLSNAHPSTWGWTNFAMQGLAFVTPIRLRSVYRKWASKSDLSGKEKFEGASRDMQNNELSDEDSEIYT
ncbi:hypothetical protein NMY22_g17053 [Coprinellus aureogranulatus]|nr:hypothetical protein NMY22_g17053 [Coprinellus aureogranulatus]